MSDELKSDVYREWMNQGHVDSGGEETCVRCGFSWNAWFFGEHRFSCFQVGEMVQAMKDRLKKMFETKPTQTPPYFGGY